MIIKTYQADTMAAALKAARTELGQDAVILKSRSIRSAAGRPGIELTAAAEQAAPSALATIVPKRGVTKFVPPSVRPSSPAASPSTSAQPHPGQSSEQFAIQVLARLDQLAAKLDQLGSGAAEVQLPLLHAIRAAGASEQTMAALLARSTGGVMTGASLMMALRQLCTEAGSVRALGPGDRVIVAGLPGSGKTSLIGRLAAEAVLVHKVPAVMASLDSQKPTAREELSLYADLIESQFVEQAPRAIRPDGIVLFDSPSLLPGTDHARFKNMIESVSPTLLLFVHAAPTRSELVEACASTLPRNVEVAQVQTMTDLVPLTMTVLNLFTAFDMPLVGQTNQSAGLSSLQPVSFDEFIQQLADREGSNG